SVYFFAAVNVAKLVPYFALGQFDASNLATSAALAPLAPLATLAGVRLIHHIRREVFYPLMYVLVALVGAKLVYDGLIAL
ncbi:MAG: sulfite exporter TauE/SafE family protein, partial [Hyphomicrobiaceae bacterium]|nr:sulfite exporter TauE/SafE family protein [Hyphomicrobiaceae bacterium]